MKERDPELADMTWPSMRRDVQTFIKRCDTCIKMTEQKRIQHTRKYVTERHGVLQLIGIDAIHMPKTKNGHKYILTIIDLFTRYTVLKPLKDLTAQTAAKALIEYMCVYGVPIHITSDNSTQFMKEFSEMVDILKS